MGKVAGNLSRLRVTIFSAGDSTKMRVSPVKCGLFGISAIRTSFSRRNCTISCIISSFSLTACDIQSEVKGTNNMLVRYFFIYKMFLILTFWFRRNW